MKRGVIISVFACLAYIVSGFAGYAQSVRPERKLINEGNKLYVERKFREAAVKYEEALKENGNSAVARYNLGLSQIQQVTNPNDSTPKNRELLDRARQNLSAVAALAKDKPGLAAKANYNLGNLEFNTNQLKEATQYYKQALRIDPGDNAARKNLRIAQLKQQNQDQNKDQNKDKNKDQNKDKNKDQNKDQNQNQNKDQNKDQNRDRDKQQEQNNNISQQTAGQILQAIDNKENQTRARVNQAKKGDKSQGAGRRQKRW